jgi:hypothetical protein
MKESHFRYKQKIPLKKKTPSMPNLASASRSNFKKVKCLPLQTFGFQITKL